MTMNGISPKQETIDAGEEYGKSIVIGTGPFKFVEWNQGQSVIFEKHTEYYKSGLPYLDRVELSLNVEPSVQMLRWESGEAEFIHTIPAAELPNVLTDEQFANCASPGADSGDAASHHGHPSQALRQPESATGGRISR